LQSTRWKRADFVIQKPEHVIPIYQRHPTGGCNFPLYGY
jgi:hypothetical protein